MKKFKVVAASENKTVYFWIKIFDTHRELEIEAKRKDNERKYPKQTNRYYQESVGLCQKWESLYVENGMLYPYIGQILLTTDVKPNVVYHELVHAALWAYELLYGNKPLVNGPSDADWSMNDEENLAYLYGDVLSMMIAKLYRYKIWK